MSASLTLGAFMTIAAQCAPSVAPDTLAAIARTESLLRPLAIGVNGAGGGPIWATTQDDAIARAMALIAAGRSIDLGIMQISHRNLGWLGLTVADAFDPCRNIAAGAAVLTAYSRYNTGSPTRGFANGYVRRVLNAGTAPAVPSTLSTSLRAMVPDIGRGAAGRDFVYTPNR